jgi:hypothetical protein
VKQDRQSGGVTIGNVTGGIKGSIIAGRDVTTAADTVVYTAAASDADAYTATTSDTYAYTAGNARPPNSDAYASTGHSWGTSTATTSDAYADFAAGLRDRTFLSINR